MNDISKIVKSTAKVGKKVLDFARSKEGKQIGKAALGFLKESGLGEKAIDKSKEVLSKKAKTKSGKTAVEGVHELTKQALFPKDHFSKNSKLQDKRVKMLVGANPEYQNYKSL